MVRVVVSQPISELEKKEGAMDETDNI